VFAYCVWHLPATARWNRTLQFVKYRVSSANYRIKQVKLGKDKRDGSDGQRR
jgi:hypothetical protein